MPPPMSFWLLLIFTYAMFIPNTWRRAAVVIGAMALAPDLLVVGMMLAYPQVADAMTAADFMQHVLTMVVAAVAAVFGTHLINTLRREAFEARQLGQYRLIRAAGRRRHGRGLPGRAPHAQAALRRQADPPRAGRRSAGPGPLRARGADDGQAVALQHRRDLRLRPHRRRHVLLRDGVPAGPEPGGAGRAARAAAGRSASSTCCGRRVRPCARPTPSA